MTPEELRAKFQKNLAYNRRIIPTEDIYEMHELTVMAALYFIHKWAEWEDVQYVCSQDPVANKWIQNIVGFFSLREKNLDAKIHMNLDQLDKVIEDKNSGETDTPSPCTNQ